MKKIVSCFLIFLFLISNLFGFFGKGQVFNNFSTVNAANYDENRVRFILADSQLGGVIGYYRGHPEDSHSVEAVRRWDQGVRVVNIDQFERKIVGSWTVTYKGTNKTINALIDIKLTTDSAPTVKPTIFPTVTPKKPTVIPSLSPLPTGRISDYTGKIIFIPTEQNKNGLYVADENGQNQKLLIAGQTIVEYSFSPAGDKIAYTAGQENGADIFLYDLKTGEKKQLTSDGKSANPYFTPDGKRITYSAYTPGGQCLDGAVMDLDGKNKKLIKDIPELAPFKLSYGGYAPKFSPDGKKILLRECASVYGAFFLYDLDKKQVYSSQEIKQKTNLLGTFQEVFSPDSNYLVFLGIKGEDPSKVNVGVYLLKTDLSEVVNLIDYGEDTKWTENQAFFSAWNLPFFANFSPDGQKVVFSLTNGVSVFDLKTKEKKSINLEGLCGMPSFSPDGQKILFGRIYENSQKTEIFSAKNDGSEMKKILDNVYFVQFFPKIASPIEVPKALNTLKDWQIENVTYFKGAIYRMEKTNWYVMLRNKDGKTRLPNGTKALVTFRLYDLKDTAKGLVMVLTFPGQVIDKVDVGKSDKIPGQTVIKIPDVALLPAFWPDTLDITVSFEEKNLAGYLFFKRDISIDKNPDKEADCAYGMTDAGIALLVAAGFPYAKVVDIGKDVINCGKDVWSCYQGLPENVKNHDYLAFGKQYVCGLLAIGSLVDPLKLIAEAWSYVTRLEACVSVLGYAKDFFTGAVEELLAHGIPINIAILSSPAELTLSSGDKKIGVINGNVVNDFGEPNQVITGHPMIIMLKGTIAYDLKVTGKEEGSIGLSVIGAREDGKVVRSDYDNVKTEKGEVMTLKVKPDSNLKKDFRLAIDKNNDGKIEQYRKPDKLELIKPTVKQKTKTFLSGIFKTIIILAVVLVLFFLFKKIKKKKGESNLKSNEKIIKKERPK